MDAPQAETLLTSPIYGGGARRAEGALAEVAPTISSLSVQPLTWPPLHHFVVPLPSKEGGC